MGDTFRLNTHGLNVDFLKLFDYVINDLKPPFKKNIKIKIEENCIETSKFSCLFDYQNKSPVLTREKVNIIRDQRNGTTSMKKLRK